MQGQRSQGWPGAGTGVFAGDDQFLDTAAGLRKGLDARTRYERGHGLQIVANDFPGNMQLFAAAKRGICRCASTPLFSSWPKVIGRCGCFSCMYLSSGPLPPQTTCSPWAGACPRPNGQRRQVRDRRPGQVPRSTLPASSSSALRHSLVGPSPPSDNNRSLHHDYSRTGRWSDNLPFSSRQQTRGRQRTSGS